MWPGHTNTECRIGIKKTKTYANFAVDEDGFKPVKTRWVRKSKETPKQNGDQLKPINPCLIEQETYVNGVSSKQSETALCSYADNTTIHKGRVNQKPSIGTKCDTINISNGFELLQGMEDNEELRPNAKGTKRCKTSITQSTREGGMKRTHPGIPPDE